MKANNMARSQMCSIGNYLMTGKLLGKGHFARVEEATHRLIAKKVAIKIIDLTCIKEEYARRHLHREPRVMARLRHPCIAALYETMMHGPRLFVVMEAAGGGDLSALVLAARAPGRGLREGRARALAAQLVSAVRHMHAQGVVHRDLKMENIMLDTSKQYIKIVDFGLSNVWAGGGGLRTHCGSLEYAAPELFVDGRRYGPEVDLWSIGVIVYGMVTGCLPFTAPAGGDGRSRPRLRAAIAHGFCRTQRAHLAHVSNACQSLIEQLLEPRVELRLGIEAAARHGWLRRAGLVMRTHPLPPLDPPAKQEIYKQISELSGQSVADVVAQIKADPFGPTGGMFNMSTHLRQLAGGAELWAATLQEPRPASPPDYEPRYEFPITASTSKTLTSITIGQSGSNGYTRQFKTLIPPKTAPNPQTRSVYKPQASVKPPLQTRAVGAVGKPQYRAQDDGDGAGQRLPSIDEEAARARRGRRAGAGGEAHPPLGLGRRAGGAGEGRGLHTVYLASAGRPGVPTRGVLQAAGHAPARAQSSTIPIKRTSLGNIASPHSSTNSHCRSEKAMPVGWYSTRTGTTRDPPLLQRFRRTAPMK